MKTRAKRQKGKGGRPPMIKEIARAKELKAENKLSDKQIADLMSVEFGRKIHKKSVQRWLKRKEK